jgi:hypothetical protein
MKAATTNNMTYERFTLRVDLVFRRTASRNFSSVQSFHLTALKIFSNERNSVAISPSGIMFGLGGTGNLPVAVGNLPTAWKTVGQVARLNRLVACST